MGIASIEAFQSRQAQPLNAIAQAEAAFIAHGRTRQQLEEGLLARIETLETIHRNSHRTANAHLTSIKAKVQEGRFVAESTISAATFPISSSTLQAGSDNAQGLEQQDRIAVQAVLGIKTELQALSEWQRRRSAALRVVLVVVLALIVAAALYFGRDYLQDVFAAGTTGEANTVATEQPGMAPTVMVQQESVTRQTVGVTGTAVAAVRLTRTTSPPTRTRIPRPTPTPRDAATRSPALIANFGPESIMVGQTSLGTPVEAVRFGNGLQTVIFIGGLHAGYSPGSVALARQTVNYFSDNPDDVPDSATLYVVISASPDTASAPGELRGRLNSNGVDANRNWDCRWTEHAKWRGETIPGSGGTMPFSEPEVRSLADFIRGRGADAVIFWEARAEGGLVSPGSCSDRSEVSESLADIYGLAAGYSVADFEAITNQELNGDGTNWLDSMGIPAISVLLPRYDSADWQNNLDGILAILDTYGQ